MIRLIGAELDRLLSRRLSLVVALAVVAVVGLFQLAVASQVSPPSPDQVAVAQQGYERDLKDWQDHHEEYQQQCIDGGGSTAECTVPQPTPQDYGLAPTPFGTIATIGVVLSAVVSMLAAYLLGSSLIGAEYGSGSIGNWLTFVPRRESVWAAKIVSVAAGAAALGAVAGALMVSLAAVVTVVIGQPLTGAGDVVATAARGVPLVIWASLIGFCAAMLTRHTVAALGVLLGYGLLYIASNILGSLIPTVSRLAPWRLETNIQAFLSYGTDYDVYQRTVTDAGVNYDSVTHHLGFGAATAYLAVVLLAVLAVTLAVFRRRDVN